MERRHAGDEESPVVKACRQHVDRWLAADLEGSLVNSLLAALKPAADTTGALVCC